MLTCPFWIRTSRKWANHRCKPRGVFIIETETFAERPTSDEKKAMTTQGLYSGRTN